MGRLCVPRTNAAVERKRIRGTDNYVIVTNDRSKRLN
jgi:hypothetical protein